MIRKNLQNKFIRIGISLFLVVISVFVYTNVINSATVDKPAFPTVTIATVPETIQPGEETTLTLNQEGFTGEYLFTNWCIDGVPLNSFYAGSTDQVVMEDMVKDVYVYNDAGEQTSIIPNSAVQVPVVKNEWGQQIGGNGYCNYPIKPLNPEPQNYNWWAGTGIVNLDGNFVGANARVKVGGEQFEDFDEDSPTFVIPRAARATIVGVEANPGSPLEPIFINSPLIDEYEPDFQDYNHSADIIGLNFFLTNLVGVEVSTLSDTDLPTGEVYTQGQEMGYYEDKEDRVKVTREHKYPSDPTYVYIKTDNASKQEYVDELKGAEYRVLEPGTELPTGYTRYTTTESYRFDEMQNELPKTETDALNAGKKIETIYYITYSFPTYIKKYGDNDVRSTDNLDAPYGYYTIVKSKLYRPAQVTINEAGYTTYIDTVFKELEEKPKRRLDLSWFEGSESDALKSVYYAYSNIFESFLKNSYDDNRALYFPRKYDEDPTTQKTAVQNPVALSRVFSYMDATETGQREGKVYVEDGNPYSNLPKYKDRDDDGLPDLWEMKYFGDLAGKKIVKPSKPKSKERVWFPSCCGGISAEGELSSEEILKRFLYFVSPSDDWDGDSFDRKNRAYQEWVNKYKGSYLYTSARGWGPVIERSKIGSTSDIGDGKCTNYEEFVMGTSPIEVDTDADGVPDELDFYGLGQDSIKVKLQKADPEAQFNVTARAYGPITRGSYEGSSHFARADATSSLKQGGDLPIEIALAITPDPVTISDTITVNAAVGNIQDMDPTLLFFQWYLNDVPIPYPVEEKPGQACPCTEQFLDFAKYLGEQSGLGKTSFTFPASLGASQACDVANIKLEVTDLKTNQSATTETQIPMRMQGVIIKSVGGNATDATYGSGENDGINGFDPKVSEVSPVDEGGVREDDVLNLTATLVGYNETTCGLPPADASYDSTTGEIDTENIAIDPTLTAEQNYMNSLTYIWTIDGIQSKVGSGIGKKTYTFKPSALPRTDPLNREGADSASEADDHDVSVQIYDWDGNPISFAEEGVKVLGPFVDFSIRGIGVTKDPTNKAGERTDQVIKGEDVTLRADGQYMRPAGADGDYEFTITRNGEIVAGPTASANPIIEYTFIAGETPDAEGFEDFVVNIVSKNANRDEIENISGSYSVQVIDEAENAETLTEGFIGRFIPNSFKGFINVFAGVSMIAIIYVFACGYVGQNKRR